MRYLVILSAALLLFACNNEKTSTASQQKDSTIVASANTTTAVPEMPDSATMMKNWQAYMTTGKEHQMLASWNGTWTGEVTMWMMPGAPPTKSITTATNKMTMGGRYQLSSQKGMFNGMLFEGMSTLGFDNAKKVFVATWIDNMGSGIIMMEGPWNETTKSMDLRGSEIDPATGKEKSFREQFRVIDNNRQIMEWYEPGPDKRERKTMEIIYTRKK